MQQDAQRDALLSDASHALRSGRTGCSNDLLHDDDDHFADEVLEVVKAPRN